MKYGDSESQINGPDLSQIFPLYHVRDVFEKPVLTEKFDLSSTGPLSEKDPQSLLQVGLTLWNQIVTRSLFIVDPRAVAPFIDDEDPFLYFRIEELLGQQLVFDLFYASLRVEDDALEWSDLCCQICVARTYPNDLILSDAYFVNPYHPLQVSQQSNKQLVGYEGLDLLGDYLSSLKAYAMSTGCERILFTASDREDVATYQELGFTVEQSQIAEMSNAVGMNIPMHLIL